MPALATVGLPAGEWPETRWRAGRRAVLLILVAAVPLVFDTSVRPAFALPKFTVAAVGAGLVVTLGLVEYGLRRSLPRWRNGLEVPVLLFLAWTAVSAAASPHVRTSVFGSRESINGLSTAIVLAVIFFAVAEAFDPPHARTALSVLWYGSGGIVLGYGAVQLHDQLRWGARWDPIPWANPRGEGAIWSTLGNPNDLAGFLAILLPIGLVLLVLGRHPVTRGVTALMVLLLVVEMLVTTGRGAVLGAVVAVFALGGWFRHEIGRRARFVAGAAAVFLVVAVGSATAFVATGQTGRDLGDLLSTGEGTTAALRVELWSTAWRMAEENPLLGVGPDRFGPSFDAFRSDRFLRVYGPELLATDAHNIFLSYLASQGFPGLFAFLFLIASAVVLLWRRGRYLSRRRPMASEEHALFAAVSAALLAYLVQAMFNRQDLVLDFCFWVLLGLACAVTGAAGTTAPLPAGARSTDPAGAGQGGDGDDRGQPPHTEGNPGDGILSLSVLAIRRRPGGNQPDVVAPLVTVGLGRVPERAEDRATPGRAGFEGRTALGRHPHDPFLNIASADAFAPTTAPRALLGEGGAHLPVLTRIARHGPRHRYVVAICANGEPSVDLRGDGPAADHRLRRVGAQRRERTNDAGHQRRGGQHQ